jgi:hypothetical protein
MKFAIRFDRADCLPDKGETHVKLDIIPLSKEQQAFMVTMIRPHPYPTTGEEMQEMALRSGPFLKEGGVKVKQKEMVNLLGSVIVQLMRDNDAVQKALLEKAEADEKEMRS